ncbi:MAG: hypothetical protein IT376_11460 [Polyangiaceae bacterium]|nr:hypothetical protein [Polyangiaceae bacterium]
MWRSALTVSALAAAVIAEASPLRVEALAGRFDPELRALEARVAREPGDATALAQLAERHAASGLAGVAYAAFARAPAVAVAEPRALHALASVHLAAGDLRGAHAAERRAVAACEATRCGAALAARAELRATWLASALRGSGEVPSRAPELRLARLELPPAAGAPILAGERADAR